jgi:hypothetical protein
MEFQQSLAIHCKLTNFLQEATDFVKMGKGGFGCLDEPKIVFWKLQIVKKVGLACFV